MKSETSPKPLADSLKFALLQQAIVNVFASMVLDGGAFAQMCLFALAAFWVGAGILLVRRRSNISRGDLLLIRWGYIPLCIVSFFLTQWIWSLRGY